LPEAAHASWNKGILEYWSIIPFFHHSNIPTPQAPSAFSVDACSYIQRSASENVGGEHFEANARISRPAGLCKHLIVNAAKTPNMENLT
jgi:hypothetical protein